MEISVFNSVLACCSLIVSSLLACKSLWEFIKAQKWKRLEFINTEIKSLFNDFNMKRAFTLLDYNEAYISTLKEEKLNHGISESFYFDEAMLLSALRYHKEDVNPLEGFTHEEIIIRNILDDFFLRLGMVNRFLVSRLIKVDDVKPYIGYYIEIIANKDNNSQSKEIRHAIWRFIDKYGYSEVQDLCLRFGYEIKKV